MGSAGPPRAGTQTDAFLPRPPTPRFVPPKRGLDAATQIADDELFDFDFEARHILKTDAFCVISGHTLSVLRPSFSAMHVDSCMALQHHMQGGFGDLSQHRNSMFESLS